MACREEVLRIYSDFSEPDDGAWWSWFTRLNQGMMAALVGQRTKVQLGKETVAEGRALHFRRERRGTDAGDLARGNLVLGTLVLTVVLGPAPEADCVSQCTYTSSAGMRAGNHPQGLGTQTDAAQCPDRSAPGTGPSAPTKRGRWGTQQPCRPTRCSPRGGSN